MFESTNQLDYLLLFSVLTGCWVVTTMTAAKDVLALRTHIFEFGLIWYVLVGVAWLIIYIAWPAPTRAHQNGPPFATWSGASISSNLLLSTAPNIRLVSICWNLQHLMLGDMKPRKPFKICQIGGFYSRSLGHGPLVNTMYFWWTSNFTNPFLGMGGIDRYPLGSTFSLSTTLHGRGLIACVRHPRWCGASKGYWYICIDGTPKLSFYCV